MRVCHAQIIFVSDLKAATKSLELELPTEDNKCSRTHYHESQIISSSQTTMPVAFFTLQDSFFCSGMDCQIFIVRGIILVCHTRCLSFTEWQGDFFPSVLSAVRYSTISNVEFPVWVKKYHINAANVISTNFVVKWFLYTLMDFP